jgi:hypothetical protein
VVLLAAFAGRIEGGVDGWIWEIWGRVMCVPCCCCGHVCDVCGEVVKVFGLVCALACLRA